MSRYHSGRRAEYRSAEWLRRLGFVVLRTAGSRGVADLVALGKGGVILVQVKYGRKPGRADVERFRRSMLDTCKHVRLDLHYWRRRAREPEIIFCGRATSVPIIKETDEASRKVADDVSRISAEPGGG